MDKIKKKVLIMEPIDGMEETTQILTDHYEVRFGHPVSQPNAVLNEEDLINRCREVNAIIGMAREKITRKVIESCPNLEVICKYGIGVDNIDVEAATDNGILVINAPVHSSTVAEAAMSIILSVLKKVPRNMAYLKKGNWRDFSTLGNDINGKSIGILGFGTIGKELANRLTGWNVRILVYDPFVSEEEISKFNGVKVNKEEALEQSDIISLHLPLNDSTYKLISYNELEKMKNNAIIINTSRGKVIDEEALIYALQNDLIAGAGLDVFFDEPLSLDNELLTMENVVVLPHVSGYTYEALYKISNHISVNCTKALKGDIPENTVNKRELFSGNNIRILN